MFGPSCHASGYLHMGKRLGGIQIDAFRLLDRGQPIKEEYNGSTFNTID